MGIELRGLRDRWRGVRLLRPADPPMPEVTGDRPLAWRTPVEAVRLIVTGVTLATAARIALVVGTLLNALNLRGVILSGRAGWVTLLQAGAELCDPLRRLVLGDAVAHPHCDGRANAMIALPGPENPTLLLRYLLLGGRS